jgi:hypothetical protein
MTMRISMPTESDLETLPIVDITSPGLWLPSEHNETDNGLSFEDPIFDPSRVAQHASHHKTATNHGSADGLETEEDVPTTDGRLEHTELPGTSTRPTMDPTPAPMNLDTPLHFFDAMDDLDLYGPCSFDHSKPSLESHHDSQVFHLSIDYDKMLTSSTVDSFLSQLNYAELRGDNEDFDTVAYASRAAIIDQAERYVEYLGYRPVNVIRKTLERTR